jgi:hypothetical protein
VNLKRIFSIINNVTEGSALKMRLLLGFFHLMFFPKIKLKVEDLNMAEATFLTMRIHMKYDPVIS